MKTNNKLRIIIFLGVTIILMISFVVICKYDRLKIDELTRSQAKIKLEESIDKSYTEENKIDVLTLKDNIKNDIYNSEIINPESSEFPIYTIIDDYEFKVEEDGKVENIEVPDIEKPEDNKEDDIPINSNNLIRYSNETKEENGIIITTTEEGLVRIKGTATERLFIKISNNIKISSNSGEFEKWKEEDGIIVEKGILIKEKITITNKDAKGGQVNVALRTDLNESIGILKILENDTEYSMLLSKDIIANYIYIDKGVEINKIEFKIEVTKEENILENLIQLKEDSKEYNGIECRTNSDGTVTLNGIARDKSFIKITNGIQMTSDGNVNTEIATKEPIIIQKDKSILINIQEIEGEYTTSDFNQELNMVLKYNDGNIATNCKLKDKNFYQEITLQKDISILYIFISKGIELDNYIIKPIVNYAKK